ncbi:hypothetical protein DMH01_34075 [Amycolatopsis sp. WAC 04182]|uniref:hypothetical protein n=1 Tax=Amycolatopsis sp. WAC 04182 TaxID=2203198 RepID=UPI000F786A32|nr:hypothetical protein [Amycolatopsis sp. WAC 04182]RSN55339.1 hypothetical protein DMH01_34075 [Amycolatopsis sp. WAC 04182]
MSAQTLDRETTVRRFPRSVLVSAWAAPLALWAIGPERAQSLSKDMHPAFAAIIVVIGVAFALACHVLPRKGAR